jgi:hypothetical protein
MGGKATWHHEPERKKRDHNKQITYTSKYTPLVYNYFGPPLASHLVRPAGCPKVHSVRAPLHAHRGDDRPCAWASNDPHRRRRCAGECPTCTPVARARWRCARTPLSSHAGPGRPVWCRHGKLRRDDQGRMHRTLTIARTATRMDRSVPDVPLASAPPRLTSLRVWCARLLQLLAPGPPSRPTKQAE